MPSGVQFPMSPDNLRGNSIEIKPLPFLINSTLTGCQHQAYLWSWYPAGDPLDTIQPSILTAHRAPHDVSQTQPNYCITPVIGSGYVLREIAAAVDAERRPYLAGRLPPSAQPQAPAMLYCTDSFVFPVSSFLNGSHFTT